MNNYYYILRNKKQQAFKWGDNLLQERIRESKKR